MKKRIFTLIVVALLMTATTVFAEDTASVFDLSAEQQQIAELGIPTVSSVAELKSKADNLWNNKDYQNAAPAYAAYAKQANWLANIISQGLEPYYGADYDDRKNFHPSSSELLIGFLANDESKSNSYKNERNRAMLYEGLCYYYLNDYETALPLISKALDLIDIKDEDNWILAKNALYAIVGY